MNDFPVSRIRHVAALAELTLSSEEEVRLAAEIGRVVAHMAELETIDTSDVPPMAHVTADAPSALRADEPHTGLSHEQALAGAPRVAHEGFSVPTFVE
jgi:aspartyl-tRNA(Asn)/glutamyl-tRNA(Gln) amidotransferase subunit C